MKIAEVGSCKIFIFSPNYDASSANEQALKKKISAFGAMPSLNPLNRPKENTVDLQEQVLRYEPFWKVEASRDCVFDILKQEKIPIENEDVETVSINDKTYQVSALEKNILGLGNAKRHAIIDLKYHCKKHIKYIKYIDGLGKQIKDEFFEKLFNNRNKLQEVNEINLENVIEPHVKSSVIVHNAIMSLTSNVISGSEIFEDETRIDTLEVYYRPVYAFRFIWTSTGKEATLEIDGLTGEIIEKGVWLKDKFKQVVTKDILFDAVGEIAGAIVPGGTAAVKIIKEIT